MLYICCNTRAILRQEDHRAPEDGGSRQLGRFIVTAQHPDPHLDVPEADLLEQQAPVDALGGTDIEAVAEGAFSLPTPSDTVDVADQLEQSEDVTSEDDEDYPHEV